MSKIIKTVLGLAAVAAVGMGAKTIYTNMKASQEISQETIDEKLEVTSEEMTPFTVKSSN